MTSSLPYGCVLQLPLESAPCYYRTSATVYRCRTITTQRPNWMTRWADGVGPDIVTLDRCGVGSDLTARLSGRLCKCSCSFRRTRVRRHRALSLLLLCFLALAACGQNPGEKGEQGLRGRQDRRDQRDRRVPLVQQEEGFVIRFQQVGCSSFSCPMSCKEGERILTAIAFTPGGVIEYQDEHHLTFRPRRIPAVLALACIAE